MEAAKLLGRWTHIAERHATGCSCCPGLGNVTMDEVEGRVLGWLRERHAQLRGNAGMTALLRQCIERKTSIDSALLADLGEALDYLERAQAGFG